MKRKQTKTVKVLAVFLAVLLVGGCVLVISQLDGWLNGGDGLSSGGLPTGNRTVTIDGQTYSQRKDITTLLIIGVDTFGEAEKSDYWINGKQADFLLLAVFDRTAETCTLIHINRDTLAEVDRLGRGGVVLETATEQIALSHAYGDGQKQSCSNTAKSVSRLFLGAKIDGYISLTMDAVPLLNDAIGGVTVTVEDDFSALGHPDWIPGATVTLSGRDALDFVRARGNVSDETNLSRMERQKQYLSAAFGKIKGTAGDGSLFETVYRTISPYSVINLGRIPLTDFSAKFASYQYAGVLSPSGQTSVNENTGFTEFTPDPTGDNSLQSLALRYFWE